MSKQQPRTKIGTYTFKKKQPLTFKRKIKIFFNLFPYAFILGVSLGVYFFGLPFEQKTVTVQQEIIIEKETDNSLKLKLEELKNNILDDLRTAEIIGYEHLDAIIVFDPRQRDLATCQKIGGVRLHCYSFGQYNFKVATVQHYYEKFYNRTPTDKEAIDIALDNDLSRELAHKVIFEEIGGINNWVNSARKINAHERIKIIRELES